MKISVVIPTHNRTDDLNKCLSSILIQTLSPREILVIDNGDNKGTVKLVAELKNKFENKKIILKYIKNEKENSLTVAKNIGVKNSAGDIISFLDDDIVLDKEYYAEIIKVYKGYPDAVGVEGLPIFESQKRKIRSFLTRTFDKLFFLGHREKNGCRVLPSLGVTVYSGNKIVNCEWLSGASTFKKQIFDNFSYDEKLKKYSWGEDTDFSYRIFKKYPKSLFVNPAAPYVHNLSLEGRTPKKEIAYMEEVYYLYLFYKIIPQNIKNKMIYLWGRIGRTIFKIISWPFGRLKFIEIIYSFEAYIFCLSHLQEIKKGDLDFFNKTLE